MIMLSISFTAQSWEYDPELKSLVKKAEPTGMQLGAGAYGSVEQVKIEGEMCAAKRFTMKIRINPNEFYGKFFAEFRILSSLCHPNIVQYHCVCPLPNSKVASTGDGTDADKPSRLSPQLILHDTIPKC